MSKSRYFLSISYLSLLVLLSIGCISSAPRIKYYWGDYSNTLYKWTKCPNEETLLDHWEMLEKIIAYSDKRNYRVPPGVYAELGYIYYMHNHNDEAIKFYKMEITTYPESKTLVQILIKKAEENELNIPYVKKEKEKKKTGFRKN